MIYILVFFVVVMILSIDGILPIVLTLASVYFLCQSIHYKGETKRLAAKSQCQIDLIERQVYDLGPCVRKYGSDTAAPFQPFKDWGK